VTFRVGFGNLIKPVTRSNNNDRLVRNIAYVKEAPSIARASAKERERVKRDVELTDEEILELAK
jgi:hypothetical protein